LELHDALTDDLELIFVAVASSVDHGGGAAHFHLLAVYVRDRASKHCGMVFGPFLVQTRVTTLGGLAIRQSDAALDCDGARVLVTRQGRTLHSSL